ncbi:MAG: hypothetical protein ACI87H_002501 [Gammaproteobacteria bacterium]|jgi:hypothetical protein
MIRSGQTEVPLAFSFWPKKRAREIPGISTWICFDKAQVSVIKIIDLLGYEN